MIFQQNKRRNSRTVTILSLFGLTLLSCTEKQAQRTIQQQEKEKQNKEAVHTSVEEMPKPPFDINKYLLENIKYPEEAKQDNIQGRTVLQFVVDKDGSVTDVVVQRDIGGGCGAEAMRVVKNMPKWIPGRQDGQPVRVYYTLPVSFKLEENSCQQVSTANSKQHYTAYSFRLNTGQGSYCRR